MTGLTAVKGLTVEPSNCWLLVTKVVPEIFVNVNDKNQLAVITDFVDTSTADLNGISFAGLTVGPQNVEGGRHAIHCLA